LEKDKTSEGDAHKTQMLEMACKVKMLEQQLKAVPDSHNNDVLKELQVIVITLKFSIISAKKSFKKLCFRCFPAYEVQIS
jgi:hypothetical protein